MTILTATGVTRRFGGHVALDGLSLEVSPGETVGLIGPSGGGKTTAVRLLSGLDRPDAGSVTLFGRPAGQLRRRDRSRVALLAQEPALVDDFSIAEHVRFAAAIRRVPADRADAAIERVGLADKAATRLADASGGMKRRAGLAAALVGDPELVLADEPTAGLDPILRDELWSWFAERRSDGRSMIVTTQHIGEATRCDRVVVLRAGSVIFDAEPERLRDTADLPESVDIVVAPAVLPQLVDLLIASDLWPVRRTADSVTIDAANAAETVGTITSLLADNALDVISIDTRRPPIDDVFRQLVENQA